MLRRIKRRGVLDEIVVGDDLSFLERLALATLPGVVAALAADYLERRRAREEMEADEEQVDRLATLVAERVQDRLGRGDEP